MQEAFFEYLANTGLECANYRDLAKVIYGQPRAKLEKLIDNLGEFIAEPTTRSSSPFEFLANATYSGAPTPCASFECRSERLRELAYFSALYADKVWFPNPFPSLKNLATVDAVRQELVFYINRLHHLRPLFDADLMELTPNASEDFCKECYVRMIGELETQNGFDKSYKKLKRELDRRYLTEVDYYVEMIDGQASLIPRGPTTLIDEHFGRYLFAKAPPQILEIARKAKSPVRLSQACAKKHDIPSIMYEDMLGDVLNQNYYALRHGTGYLTQRSVDLELINALASQPIRDTNTLLGTSFSHELPVIGGIELRELLKVRRDNGDSFQVYRDALSKAINDVKDDDPRKMNQAFRDIVKPEIHRVNAALGSARKILLKDVLVSTAVATGVVGVGLFAGILPQNIGQIVAALGGYHFFQGAGSKLAGFVLEPPSLKENSFYFLWKVMRHGKTR